MDTQTAGLDVAREGADRKGLVDYALQYAARGWPVFQLSKSKKPFKGSHGFLDATTDLATIEEWWARRPGANIGLATGHGLIVLDVDGPTAPIKDPWGFQRSAATATTKVNRQDFGVKWNATLDNGGVVVADDVSITIDVEMVKKDK